MRSRLRSLPIRWQITVLQTLILAFVLASLGILVWTQQRAFLLDSAVTRLRAQAQPVIETQFTTPPAPSRPARPPRLNNSNAALAPRPPDLEPPVRNALSRIATLLAARDTAATVLALDGSTIAQGGGLPNPTPDSRVFRRAVDGSTEERFTATNGEEPMIGVFMPLQQDGTTIAVAQISTPLRPITDSLWRLAWYLGVGAVLAVVLATLLGVHATRRVLRPLEGMVQTTRRIAAGDLSQRVGLPPTGTEIAQLGVAFDRMIERLETTFATQRRFIADAAHELRTPLTSLSTSVELLLIGADDADPVRQQRMLQHLNTELNRLTRLTNDLLMLSRLDTQPLLDLRPLDMSALLHDIAEQQRMIGTHIFSTQIAPDLWIMGDADRLRQIMLNLLDNARKYTPPGGQIALQAQPAGEQVRVIVQDAGAGIPADALPHLFERFYRVDSARARKQGGSGLGLAIVHSLVQAHGGQISVQSQLGSGTRVELLFPQARSSANLQLQSGEASATPVIMHT